MHTGLEVVSITDTRSAAGTSGSRAGEKGFVLQPGLTQKSFVAAKLHKISCFIVAAVYRILDGASAIRLMTINKFCFA